MSYVERIIIIHTIHWIAECECTLTDYWDIHYLQSLQGPYKIDITSPILQMSKSPQKVGGLKIKPIFAHLESFQND